MGAIERSARMDCDSLAGRSDKATNVCGVRREDVCARRRGELDDRRIDDIGRSCFAEQSARSMRGALVEAHDVAAAQKASELNLPIGTARLSDDSGRNERNEPGHEPNAMLRPRRAITSIGGDEEARVVDSAAHRRALRRAPNTRL